MKMYSICFFTMPISTFLGTTLIQDRENKLCFDVYVSYFSQLLIKLFYNISTVDNLTF